MEYSSISKRSSFYTLKKKTIFVKINSPKPMKLKLHLAFLLMSFVASAQYTLIPDINFENKLIALHIDSGTSDGKVLTANVQYLSALSVDNCGINDLKGIEDFTSLTYLSCNDNQLTTIDISKNTILIYLLLNVL